MVHSRTDLSASLSLHCEWPLLILSILLAIFVYLEHFIYCGTIIALIHSVVFLTAESFPSLFDT